MHTDQLHSSRHRTKTSFEKLVLSIEHMHFMHNVVMTCLGATNLPSLIIDEKYTQ